MIAQGRWHTTSYAISLKDSSLSLAINGDHIVVCDRAGRLYSVFRAGLHYRRSLNGAILQKWTTDERQRCWLDQTEADQLIDDAAGQFRQLQAALGAPDWEWVTPPDRSSALDDLLKVIEQAARFDRVTARLDAARFAEVYAPIGILPPDQYLALVLQATVGCSFNTCTFCDLYHQPFRIKTPDEFRWHVREVREYLGESLLLRQRSIFLGAANALAIPMPRLLPLLDIIQEEVGRHCEEHPAQRAAGGAESKDATKQSRFAPQEIASQTALAMTAIKVYAFLDAFTGTRKSVEDYRALAERGLQRVYIGLESGHDPLLEFVRKPGRARDAIETVRAIKAAGINAGLIVLIGLGGERFAAGHAADTIKVLNQMQLGSGDLLYFSDLVEEPGTPYPVLAEQHGLRALDQSERAAQRHMIRSGLSPSGVKISNYDVREFVY
jgi:Radical SAM superfamily